MKNIQRLLESYRDDQRISSIVQSLNQDAPARLQLEGLAGSAESFILAGTYLSQPRHNLFIATDKETAAYIQNDISSLLDKKAIRFFPDSFKRPMNFERLNNTNVLQRTETINKITSGHSIGEVIVTYPEALFELSLIHI